MVSNAATISTKFVFFAMQHVIESRYFKIISSDLNKKVFIKSCQVSMFLQLFSRQTSLSEIGPVLGNIIRLISNNNIFQ